MGSIRSAWLFFAATKYSPLCTFCNRREGLDRKLGIRAISSQTCSLENFESAVGASLNGRGANRDAPWGIARKPTRPKWVVHTATTHPPTMAPGATVAHAPPAPKRRNGAFVDRTKGEHRRTRNGVARRWLASCCPQERKHRDLKVFFLKASTAFTSRAVSKMAIGRVFGALARPDAPRSTIARYAPRPSSRRPGDAAVPARSAFPTVSVR